MGQHLRVILRAAQLFFHLLHASVDDVVDVLPEKPFHIIAPQRLQCAQAHLPVLLEIPEQLEQPLLPQQRSLPLFQQGHRLLLEHPAQQIINVLKVVVKILALHAALFHQLLNGNLIQRLLCHQFFQGVRHGPFGLAGRSVAFLFHRSLLRASPFMFG